MEAVSISVERLRSHLSLYFGRGFFRDWRRFDAVAGAAPVGSAGEAWSSQAVMPSASSGGLMR